MDKRAVITRIRGGTVYVEYSGNTAVKSDIFYDGEKNILDNIYVGYVKDVVKNIGCAFVEYEEGKKAYLQLTERLKPIFLNRKNTDKLTSGDRIIIQIAKEAVKTKDPVCTTNFQLSGRYAVIVFGNSGIGFSKKITDREYKKNFSEILSARILEKISDWSNEFGITIRTNAFGADNEQVLDELFFLISQGREIIEKAKTRSKNCLLWENEKGYMTLLRDLNFDEDDRITTDDSDIYNEIQTLGLRCRTEFYSDKLLPLYKLCSMEKVFSDITDRKIWLKSGGYLIIDYTEAMTVIDVNTGKCEKGKDREKTFLSINIEAAGEIARLLSLRNISGIIIVDFIDMERQESRDALLSAMKEYAAFDKISTNVVDFTRLHLMEITRKKTRDIVKIRDGIVWNENN